MRYKSLLKQKFWPLLFIGITIYILHRCSGYWSVATVHDDEYLRYKCQSPMENPNGTAPRRLASRLRKYISASLQLQNMSNNSRLEPEAIELQCQKSYLERTLFPFLKRSEKTVEEWKNSFKTGRGFAVAVSSNFLRFAAILIQNIRLLGCQLPIEVFYNGEKELSNEERNYLVSLGTRPIDIASLIDDTYVQLNGFAIKPFALFFSSFRETILLDSDTLFFRNPELLFDDPDYKKTGTLYFLDRYWHGSDEETAGPKWFDNNMPLPISSRMKKLQMYRGLSNNQMEAGVVLIDKYRNIYGALAACRLLMEEERKTWYYNAFWGDKESFWIAFELIDQEYSVHPWRPGIVGVVRANEKTHKPEVCGNVVHPGRDGRPFWFNGGLVAKYRMDYNAQPFSAFAIEGDVDTSNIRDSCLEDVEPQQFNSHETNLTQQLTRYWKLSYKTIQSFKPWYRRLFFSFHPL